MTIDTTTILKDLRGDNLIFDTLPMTLGHAIAQILAYSKKSYLKSYILARTFYSDAQVDLDDADAIFVREAINTTEAFNAMVTGQVLQIMEEQKHT
jgi:hypothetical protein